MLTSAPDNQLTTSPEGGLISGYTGDHSLMPTKGSDVLPWLAKGGFIGSGLQDLFGGGDDEYKGTDPDEYLSQIPDVLKKYFAPYQKMALDPTGELATLGAGYKESPGYEFELGQALKSGTQAAAAGGMAGSPMQQQMAQQTATGLAGQDYYKYLEDAMRTLMGGAQGYGQLGENLASNLMSRSQLAQLREEEAERARQQRESDVWGTIGTIGGAAAKVAPFL